MSTPFISIIIPAFNEEKYIGECIDSLKNQKTSVLYEIILIDNNSTDKTHEIGKRLGVRVITEKRQGRAYARQRGVKEARGEILLYIEADCTAPPTWIQTIAHYFISHPSTVGVTGQYRYRNSTPLLTYIQPIACTLEYYMQRIRVGHYLFKGTNFAIRKEVFDHIKGFNPDAGPQDDNELSIQAGKFGHIAYLPHVQVFTVDRRVRGRMLMYLFTEYFPGLLRFVFKKKSSDHVYTNIR